MAFLKLCLGHWEESSACPHLEGLHLLEISALYANVETVKLLAETDHKKLRYDAKYPLKDFAKRLTERVDRTNKLKEAFDELLPVLNRPPITPTSMSEKSLLEKGLLGYPSALATLNESEKIAANASHHSGQRRGYM